MPSVYEPKIAQILDQALATYEGPTPSQRALKALREVGLEVYPIDDVNRIEKSRQRLAERVKSLNKDKRDILADFGDALIKTREYVHPGVKLPALEGWSWYDVMKKHLPRVLDQVMAKEAQVEAIAAEDDIPVSDVELPGMWEKADFEGGKTDNEAENHKLMFPSDSDGPPAPYRTSPLREARKMLGESLGMTQEEAEAMPIKSLTRRALEAGVDAQKQLMGLMARLNDLVDEDDGAKYADPEAALDEHPNPQDVLFRVFKAYKQERDQARSIIPSIIAAADNTISDMNQAFMAYERKIASEAEERAKRTKANSSINGWRKVKETIENA